MTFPSRASVVTRDGGRPRNYYQPPEKVIGYPLDGWWGIVEPPAANVINLVTNPSVELATTGYAGRNGAAIARATGVHTRRGAYGLTVTPTTATDDGVIYTIPTSLVATTGYVFGVDFKGTAGLPYRVAFGTSASVLLDAGYAFRATGYWQRLMIYRNEILTASRRVMVYKDNSANIQPFDTDGWLVAASDTADPLMYFDGDKVGYVPNRSDFYWNGVPHASTSTMRAFTRAGGRIKTLSQLGFTLLATLGLGLAAPNNVTLPLALPGGEQYQDTLAIARTFDLLGFIQGASLPQLQKMHSSLSGLLDTRRRPYHQPMTLLYEALDECGVSASELLQIQCSFAGGMEGSRDNHYRENLDLRFRIHLPYVAIADGNEGAAFNLNTSVANANYIIYRALSGQYSALGTGADATVYRVLIAGRTLYAAGAFTSMNGVANTQGMAQYNLDTGVWSAMGTGANGDVYDMALDANGNLVVVGFFTSMGGVANTRYIALWNGAAWSAVGTGGTGGTHAGAIAIGSQGYYFVGGDFTDMGGISNTDNLAVWTGSAWASLGVINGRVYDIVFSPDDNLYMSGAFTDTDGTAAIGIAKFDLTTITWSPLAQGATTAGDIAPLEFSPSGILYVGGTFTTINGGLVNANNLAQWNGVAWQPLGLGVTGGFGVGSLKYNPFNNRLYIGGDWTNVNGVPQTASDSLTIWNGSTFLTPDVNLPGAPRVYAITVDPNTGDMVFGFTTAGTAASSAAVTIVTNTSTADAFPIIKITQGGTFGLVIMFQLGNATTGENIFMGLTLISGETITFDFTPGVKSITSNIRGNRNSAVDPGSQFQTFHLAPGANTLFVYQSIQAGPNPSGSIFWPPTYAEIDDAVR